MTYDEYINSLERQKIRWIKERDFQQHTTGDASNMLYIIACVNIKHLEEEIKFLVASR